MAPCLLNTKPSPPSGVSEKKEKESSNKPSNSGPSGPEPNQHVNTDNRQTTDNCDLHFTTTIPTITMPLPFSNEHNYEEKHIHGRSSVVGGSHHTANSQLVSRSPLKIQKLACRHDTCRVPRYRTYYIHTPTHIQLAIAPWGMG